MEARRNLSRICSTALYSAQSFAQWSSRKSGEIRVHARINFGGRRWKMYVCWTYTAKLYVVHAKGGSQMIYFFHWPLLVLGCTSVLRSSRLILVKSNYQGDRKILPKSFCDTFLVWPLLTSKWLLRLNQKKMLIRVHIFMTIRKRRQ